MKLVIKSYYFSPKCLTEINNTKIKNVKVSSRMIFKMSDFFTHPGVHTSSNVTSNKKWNLVPYP